MKLLYVEIKNFLSYGSPTQRVDLDNKGLVAVLGSNVDSKGADSNGAGKSTILEAIVWGLYGKTMRSYRGDDVVNRKEGRGCLVSVALEDGGDVYVIRRTRKAAAKKPNEVHLLVNGSQVTQGVNTDTQALIQTVVGMDCTTFTQSVMLWHDISNRPFSQMNDKDQKAVLEDILQIDRIAKAHGLAKARKDLAQNRLLRAQGEAERLQLQASNIHTLLSKYALQKKQHRDLQVQKKNDILSKKAAIEVRLEEVYHNTGLDKLLKLHDDLVKDEENLGKRRSDVQTARLEITRLFANKRSIVARSEGTANGRLFQIRDDVEEFDRIVGKPCPSCRQVLTPESAELFITQWEAEADHIRARALSSAKQASEDLEAEESSELTKLADKESSVQSEWSTLQHQIRSTAGKINQRQATLSLISQLEQQAWSFQKEAERVSTESDPYQSLIDDAQVDLRTCGAALTTSQYQLKSIGLELQHLNYWLEGFSNKGLKSYIIDNVVPFLTERAQEYADVVSGGDLRIEFTTQKSLKSGETREKFQVNAVNRQGADMYHGNSAGEKRRIDLAVGWALADLAASRSNKPIKFRALDEPFESLDFTGEELVVKLLHGVVGRFETIMVVTHSEHLSSHFTNKILVVKKGGYTHVI